MLLCFRGTDQVVLFLLLKLVHISRKILKGFKNSGSSSGATGIKS